MAVVETNDDLVFNYRTLRVIIGALAFAFPAMVIALTGQVTNSISASYHEPQTRNLFVGFLFIISALLISYKGHTKKVDETAQLSVWARISIHEEDWISTIGGFAGLVTALFPTNCKTCDPDTNSQMHMIGAFILFAAVVYFCLVGFLRRVNEKLLDNAEINANATLMGDVVRIKSVQGRGDVNLPKRFVYFWFAESFVFLKIVRVISRNYDEQHGGNRLTKFKDLWTAYDKKIPRGWVYLVCGYLIALVLLAFIIITWRLPGFVAHSRFTFLIEAIALVLFGIAWMTASQLRYWGRLRDWLAARRQKEPAVPQAGAA
jgi:hypothetical protein